MQCSLLAPDMLPEALPRWHYMGNYGTGHLPGGRECELYIGLKCPCCSEKGDSEKKAKSVPFAAAKFPSHCCARQRDAQSQITQAGVTLHQRQNKQL